VWVEHKEMCEDKVDCGLGTYYEETTNECIECSDPECSRCDNGVCEECFASHYLIVDGVC